MKTELTTIGWREWISLPELELPFIKAKIDTGARTSCLHAFDVKSFSKDNEEWVRFGIHPYQNDSEREIFCEAKVLDKRTVTDSGGHKEERYVISTKLALPSKQYFTAEITLSNRDSMRFRMLLGRTAMEKNFIVNPAESYMLGKPTDKG